MKVRFSQEAIRYVEKERAYLAGGPTGLWLVERLGIGGSLSGPETMLAVRRRR